MQNLWRCRCRRVVDLKLPIIGPDDRAEWFEAGLALIPGSVKPEAIACHDI